MAPAESKRLVGRKVTAVACFDSFGKLAMTMLEAAPAVVNATRLALKVSPRSGSCGVIEMVPVSVSTNFKPVKLPSMSSRNETPGRLKIASREHVNPPITTGSSG